MLKRGIGANVSCKSLVINNENDKSCWEYLCGAHLNGTIKISMFGF